MKRLLTPEVLLWYIAIALTVHLYGCGTSKPVEARYRNIAFLDMQGTLPKQIQQAMECFERNFPAPREWVQDVLAWDIEVYGRPNKWNCEDTITKEGTPSERCTVGNFFASGVINLYLKPNVFPIQRSGLYHELMHAMLHQQRNGKSDGNHSYKEYWAKEGEIVLQCYKEHKGLEP